MLKLHEQIMFVKPSYVEPVEPVYKKSEVKPTHHFFVCERGQLKESLVTVYQCK